MASAIPDRWLSYKPFGCRIEGTRFVAFKVPLQTRIVKAVDEDKRLDDVSLLKNIPNLGIIIDLTNTNRYYNPDVFRSKGVEYKKIMIPGHQTPSEKLVNQFKLYVMSFLNTNKDNDKLIGVHCTHGVNRTGYMICNYMISELDIKPIEAIERFTLARGHKIERENYLNALHDLETTVSEDYKQSRSCKSAIRHDRDNKYKYQRHDETLVRKPNEPDQLHLWRSTLHHDVGNNYEYQKRDETRNRTVNEPEQNRNWRSELHHAVRNNYEYQRHDETLVRTPNEPDQPHLWRSTVHHDVGNNYKYQRRDETRNRTMNEPEQNRNWRSALHHAVRNNYEYQRHDETLVRTPNEPDQPHLWRSTVHHDVGNNYKYQRRDETRNRTVNEPEQNRNWRSVLHHAERNNYEYRRQKETRVKMPNGRKQPR